MKVVYLGSFATIVALIEEIEQAREELPDEIKRLAKQAQEMLPEHGVILESSLDELKSMKGNILYRRVELKEIK